MHRGLALLSAMAFLGFGTLAHGQTTGGQTTTGQAQSRPLPRDTLIYLRQPDGKWLIRPDGGYAKTTDPTGSRSGTAIDAGMIAPGIGGRCDTMLVCDLLRNRVYLPRRTGPIRPEPDPSPFAPDTMADPRVRTMRDLLGVEAGRLDITSVQRNAVILQRAR